MLKKLTKVVITPLLSQLQGWPGWQKNRDITVKLAFAFGVFFCAKIKPKLNRIQKTIR